MHSVVHKLNLTSLEVGDETMGCMLLNSAPCVELHKHVIAYANLLSTEAPLMMSIGSKDFSFLSLLTQH